MIGCLGLAVPIGTINHSPHTLQMNLTNWVGLAYAFISIPSIFLQLITLAVFAFQPEFRQLPCYRIMFSMGLADTAQLLVHAIDGVAMMCDYLFTAWSTTILGAMLFSGWMTMVAHHAVLAVNRLMVLAEGAISAECGTAARERRVASVCSINPRSSALGIYKGIRAI